MVCPHVPKLDSSAPHFIQSRTLVQGAFAAARPVGSALDKIESDPFVAAAAAPLARQDAIKSGTYFMIPSINYFGYSLLLQAQGTVKGAPGIYEYIVPINKDFFS